MLSRAPEERNGRLLHFQHDDGHSRKGNVEARVSQPVRIERGRHERIVLDDSPVAAALRFQKAVGHAIRVEIQRVRLERVINTVNCLV